MKRLLILSVLIVVLISCLPVFATANDNVLKNSKVLDSNQCYISGVFAAEGTAVHMESFIHMMVTNLDSNEIYDIPFNRDNQYYHYLLPAGKYKISSFDLHIPRINDADNKSFWAKVGFNITWDTMILNVNPEFFKEFELKSGDNLYLGDYVARFSFKGFPFYSDVRTAKISLYNTFEKYSQDYTSDKMNPSLNLRSLDIKEYVTGPVTDPAYENQKAVIAGRFILNGKSNPKFEIHFFNLATKNTYKVRFEKGGKIQNIEVTPGEYYIKTIYYGGSGKYKSGLFYELIPRELMLPFVIQPNELTYLGCISLEEGKVINSMYLNDFEIAQSELKDDFREYTITGVKEKIKSAE